jgi:hypothetical protein
MSDDLPPLPNRVETLISGASPAALAHMARFATRSSILYSQAGRVLLSRVEIILADLRAGRISEATAHAADIVATSEAARAQDRADAGELHPAGHA